MSKISKPKIQEFINSFENLKMAGGNVCFKRKPSIGGVWTEGRLSRELLRKLSAESYKKSPAQSIQDGNKIYRLVLVYPNFVIYRNKNENDYIIAIRGTRLSSMDDLGADFLSVFGKLKNSSRYKKDTDNIKHFIRTHPGYGLVIVSHSLSGAIVKEWLKDPTITSHIKYTLNYNSAFQPSDVFNKPEVNEKIHDVYSSSDPLYKIREFIQPDISKHENIEVKQEVTEKPILEAHSIDNPTFEGGLKKLFDEFTITELKEIIKAFKTHNKINITGKNKEDAIKEISKHLRIKKNIVKPVKIGFKFEIKEKPKEIKIKKFKKEDSKKKEVKKEETKKKEEEIKVEDLKLPEKVKDLIPPVVPKKEEQEIKKRVDYIKNLINLGEKKEIPTYYPSAILSNMLCIIFYEKYSSLPVRPLYLDYEKSKFDVDKKYKDYLSDLIDKALSRKLKNLIVYFAHSAHGKITYSHANILIINLEQRYILRFEPHGAQFRYYTINDDKINDSLERIVSYINKKLKLTKNKFDYLSPSYVVPQINYEFRKGFQSIEGREARLEQEGGGYCLLWSWFFASLVLANPDLKISEIYKETYNFIGDEPKKYKDVIRGFFHYINDELKEYQTYFKEIKDEIKLSDKQIFREDKSKNWAISSKILSDYVDEKYKELLEKPAFEYGKGISDKFKYKTKSGKVINLFH